jgi:hypothetical protein
MSNTSGPLPGLPNADSPIRTIALQRLKLNVPVLVAFYVWIHSDFYTYILKRSFGIKLMQVLLNVWEVGQETRIKSGTSEVARREKANDAFEWLFGKSLIFEKAAFSRLTTSHLRRNTNLRDSGFQYPSGFIRPVHQCDGNTAAQARYEP